MEIPKKQLNSWHWLIICVVLSLIASIGSCHAIRKKMTARRAKTLPEKQDRVEMLSMLNIETVEKINAEINDFSNELKILKIEEKEGEMNKMPLNSDGVLKITTELNKHLIENKLRLVERALKEEQPEPAKMRAGTRRVASARKGLPSKVKKSSASSVRAPFKTVEYCFKVEGQYKNMFMFLVKQSFKRRPYHLKDIEVINHPNRTMRLNFTLQVNYRK
jgi:hypothetical protein